MTKRVSGIPDDKRISSNMRFQNSNVEYFLFAPVSCSVANSEKKPLYL